MSEINAVLDDCRAAVADFIAAAERCEPVWLTPRAPGKWSPSQVSEHVARTLEEAAHQVAGVPGAMKPFPALVRPLMRIVLLNRVLKKGTFPKARTAKALDPMTGPATPALARARLQEATARLEQACRERAAAGGLAQTVLFGAIPVLDYARFEAAHTRHHAAQLPVSS